MPIRKEVTPMDSGYAWIILLASATIYVIQSGIVKSFGILYTELLVTYNAGAGNTAWIGSLHVFFLFAIGPIANYLSNKFSFRIVVMTGGLLMSIGYLVSAFVPRMEWMFLTIGVISGIGGGLIFSPCTALVSFYFEKRRALANGIVVSGSGIGSFLFPYFYRYSIDEYGIQGSMFLFSAAILQMCVAGALLRQPYLLQNAKCDLHEDSDMSAHSQLFFDQNQSKNEPVKTKKVQIIDISLFRIPRLNMYVISFSFIIFSYSSGYSVFPAYMQSVGIEEHNITIALSMIGATEVFARLFFGWLSDLKIVQKKTIMIFSAAVSGTATIVIQFLHNFPSKIIYGCVIGIFPGAFWSLMAVAVLDCVKLDRLTSAMGLLILCMSFGQGLGQPSMGWLEDATGSWDMSLTVMGVCYYIAGVVLMLEPVIEKIYVATSLYDPGAINTCQQLRTEGETPEHLNNERTIHEDC